MLRYTATGHTPHMGQNCYRRTRDVIPLIPIQQSRVGAALKEPAISPVWEEESPASLGKERKENISVL